MLSFVPLALSYQNGDLPDAFPKFVISIGEVALGGPPAAFFQFSYWSDDEGYAIGGDLLWLSPVISAWRDRNAGTDED